LRAIHENSLEDDRVKPHFYLAAKMAPRRVDPGFFGDVPGVYEFVDIRNGHLSILHAAMISIGAVGLPRIPCFTSDIFSKITAMASTVLTLSKIAINAGT
jgi:hypothetical protein